MSYPGPHTSTIRLVCQQRFPQGGRCSHCSAGGSRTVRAVAEATAPRGQATKAGVPVAPKGVPWVVDSLPQRPCDWFWQRSSKRGREGGFMRTPAWYASTLTCRTDQMSSGLVDVRQVGHDSPGPVTAKHRDSFSNHHAGGITMAPDCTSRSQPLKKVWSGRGGLLKCHIDDTALVSVPWHCRQPRKRTRNKSLSQALSARRRCRQSEATWGRSLAPVVGCVLAMQACCLVVVGSLTDAAARCSRHSHRSSCLVELAQQPYPRNHPWVRNCGVAATPCRQLTLVPFVRTAS